MKAPTMRWLKPALAIVTAVAAGVGSAVWSLKRVPDAGLAVGPWQFSLLAGSSQADAHTRARVALGALLALERRETMYYLAQHDSQGAPLRARCHYRVSGVPPAARWWSLTAYADDLFLFPDDAQRYSLNGSTAVLDASGQFHAASGPTAAADAAWPWLPTPGDRGLRFVLRVYQPAAGLGAEPASLVPPRIEAQGHCR